MFFTFCSWPSKWPRGVRLCEGSSVKYNRAPARLSKWDFSFSTPECSRERQISLGSCIHYLLLFIYQRYSRHIWKYICLKGFKTIFACKVKALHPVYMILQTALLVRKHWIINIHLIKPNLHSRIKIALRLSLESNIVILQIWNILSKTSIKYGKRTRKSQNNALSSYRVQIWGKQPPLEAAWFEKQMSAMDTLQTAKYSP